MRDRVHWRGNVIFEDIGIQSNCYPSTLLYPFLFLMKRLLLTYLLLASNYEAHLTFTVIVHLLMMMTLLLILPFISIWLTVLAVMNEAFLLMLSL